ncbi:N-acetyltransferase family protein [Ensifer canadensis]
MAGVTIVAATEADRSAWNELHAGFAAFYGVDQTDEMRDRVWGWIRDGELECRLALDGSGRPIGLTHFREYIRPLMAARGGFLDDLFVAPEARGSGAAPALIRAVADIGQRAGLVRHPLDHARQQLPGSRPLRSAGHPNGLADL